VKWKHRESLSFTNKIGTLISCLAKDDFQTLARQQGKRIAEIRSRHPCWRKPAQTPCEPASQGALFFGDFLLGKQKKVTSRRAAPGEVEVKA